VEIADRTSRPQRRLPVVLALAAALLVLTGCGDSSSYKNDPRPPSPINVTAYISPTRVSVSPTTFGAGPIVLIVTNQSDTSQEATFQTDSGDGLNQTTNPINPGNTAQIKANVPEGTYVLRTGNDAVAPATVTVDAERPSAQNDVLQP
jgi:hypothetical protein